MSVMAGRSAQIGAVMIMLFAVSILNILAASSCRRLTKTISEKENQLAKLEDECRREGVRWAEMQTPRRIEAALLRHGRMMKYPKEIQIVRMDAGGRPYPGQASVARAAERNKALVAQAETTRPGSVVRASQQAVQPRGRAPRRARR